MNLADIQVAYYMVAATGVLVAALFHIINLRHNMRAREMEICRLHTSDFVSEEGLRRYNTVMNMEWNDYEDFMKKYGPSNPEMVGKWGAILFMLEASGIIVKNKVVEPELFYELGAIGAIPALEKFKDVIQGIRALYGQDQLRNAEFLAQEMQRIRARNAARFKETVKPTPW